MFKKLLNKKLLKNQKGLTIVELLAVLVILAIVAFIAVPAIGNIIENSRYNAVKADAVNVLNAANLYYTDNPEDKNSIKISDLKDAGYLDNPGKIPGDANVTSGVPRKLTATVKDVLKAKIEFKDTTLETISVDKQKGSKIDGDSYTVGKTTK